MCIWYLFLICLQDGTPHKMELLQYFKVLKMYTNRLPIDSLIFLQFYMNITNFRNILKLWDPPVLMDLWYTGLHNLGPDVFREIGVCQTPYYLCFVCCFVRICILWMIFRFLISQLWYSKFVEWCCDQYWGLSFEEMLNDTFSI